MHISLRTSLMMGIAAAGAGVIAAVPAATPGPVTIAAPQPITSTADVSLGAAALPFNPAVGSQELVGLGNAVAAGANAASRRFSHSVNTLPPLPSCRPGCSAQFSDPGCAEPWRR